MQATFSYESMEDMKSMYYEQKDVNTWFMFEKMTSNLQQEMCDEIDREILKKLTAQFAEEKERFDQHGCLRVRL